MTKKRRVRLDRTDFKLSDLINFPGPEMTQGLNLELPLPGPERELSWSDKPSIEHETPDFSEQKEE